MFILKLTGMFEWLRPVVKILNSKSYKNILPKEK